MFVVQIDFHHPSREFDVDAIESLLAAWLRCGHLVVYPSALVRLADSIRATAVAADREALAEDHAGPTVRSEMAAVRAAGTEIRAAVVGPHASGVATCACLERTEYMLFTRFLEEASPLRCGSCFGPVPLYRVPTEPGREHVDVLGWQDDYRACDTLQMHCGVGERFGERQMRDVGSALTRFGRELCASLELRLGAPVYYVLYDPRLRLRGASPKRPCPICGGAWLLAEPLHGFIRSRCEPCRLLGGSAD